MKTVEEPRFRGRRRWLERVAQVETVHYRAGSRLIPLISWAERSVDQDQAHLLMTDVPETARQHWKRRFASRPDRLPSSPTSFTERRVRLIASRCVNAVITRTSTAQNGRAGVPDDRLIER